MTDVISKHVAFIIYCYGKYKLIKDNTAYNFERYANKYNYTLIISEQENNYNYPWIKLNSFNLLDSYDWVITCDLDVYISPSCPDIINLCNENSFNQITNTLMTTSSLFVIHKSLLKYRSLFLNYVQFIDKSIKDNCIKCIPDCNMSEYRDVIDEECWLTRMLYLNQINKHTININMYTTNRDNILLPADCYRYNMIHFNSYNYHNILNIIPELFKLLDKKEKVNILNRYILNKWGNQYALRQL